MLFIYIEAADAKTQQTVPLYYKQNVNADVQYLYSGSCAAV